MSDSVLIRLYRPEDLPVLRRITVDSFSGVAIDEMLEQKYGQWNERNWRDRKADQIDDDCAANPSGVFVAEAAGRIIGYITTRADRLNGRGRVPNLAVTEEARGQGLGKQLILHALDYFRAEGLHVAVIETMETNPVGQHLYPACGFEELGRQVHFSMQL